MGHADGICHIYVDKEADLDKAVSVIIDAKFSMSQPAMQWKPY